MKYFLITFITILLFFVSQQAYCQYHIIGMNKVAVQSTINQKVAEGYVTDKKVGFSSEGKETWIWTDTKDGLKYVAYFNNFNQVENCLLIPLNTQYLNRYVKLYNTIMRKGTDTYCLNTASIYSENFRILLFKNTTSTNLVHVLLKIQR